jgi:hypothetical protein
MQRRRYAALLPMGVLALVLLSSQTLGLLHGIAHGPSIAGGPIAQQGHVAEVVATDQHDHEAGDLLSRLFSGHRSQRGDSDCRLYDQSSHLDVMPGLPLVLLPLLLPPFVFSVLSGLAVARWHALFQARGPPPVR